MVPLVYEESRRLARSKMAGVPPGQTRQPTALAHEAYLRLGGKAGRPLESRRHFFAAACAVCDLLIERAGHNAGPKRDGGRRRVPRPTARSAVGPSGRCH